jgi:hypothetical protein
MRALISPKSPSTFRSVLLGAMVWIALVAVLSVLYWLFRPFVWAALYQEPYPGATGSYKPESGEWLWVQAINLVASVGAGLVASPHLRKGSVGPPATLFAVCTAPVVLSAIVGSFPLEASATGNAVYALASPIGLAVGLWLRGRPRGTSEA